MSENTPDGKENQEQDSETALLQPSVRRKDSVIDIQEYTRTQIEDLQGQEQEVLVEGEEELCDEEPTRDKPHKGNVLTQLMRRKTGERAVRRHMEYDLKDMYPEMELLVANTKSKLNYQDPATIRALWLESKTNALAEWKMKYSKIKLGRKPKIEVRDTFTTDARKEFRKLKEEKERKDAEKVLADSTKPARDAPIFESVDIVSNATTDMRFKYNQNNPTVPRYYIEHFQIYKKPPFRVAVRVGKRC